MDPIDRREPASEPASGDGTDAALQLLIAAVPGNVGLGRAAVRGAAEALGLRNDSAARLVAMGTEAVADVVRHAYRDNPGTVELNVSTGGRDDSHEQSVSVSVRDRGHRDAGETPPSSPMRFGLSAIGAFAERFDIRSHRDGSSLEATLTFRSDDPEVASDGGATDNGPEVTDLWLSTAGMAWSVIPRILGAHARGRGATIEVIAESMILGEAIARAISEGTGAPGRIKVGAEVGGPGLTVTVGPMSRQAADDVVAAVAAFAASRPIVTPVCEPLTTEAGTDVAIAVPVAAVA